MNEARRSNPTWTCIRHTNPEEILSIDNDSRSVTFVSKKIGDRNYWNNLGALHGPGFKAWPNDFPEGTKITISAFIELPK